MVSNVPSVVDAATADTATFLILAAPKKINEEGSTHTSDIDGIVRGCGNSHNSAA